MAEVQRNTGTRAMLVAGAVALSLIAVAGCGDDDDETIGTGGTAVPAGTDAPPATEAPPPETEAPVETDPPPATEAPPPTTGAPPATDAPPVTEAPPPATEAPDAGPTLDEALDDLVASMQSVLPTDGGKLDERGAFLDVTPGETPLDIDLRMAVSEAGQLVVFIVGPVDFFGAGAVEVDAVASNGALVAEATVAAVGGSPPPWLQGLPDSPVIAVDDVNFDPESFSSERIAAIVTTAINLSTDFETASTWLYSGFADGRYCFGHYEVLHESLRREMDTSPVRQIAARADGSPDATQAETLVNALDDPNGSVFRLDRGLWPESAPDF